MNTCTICHFPTELDDVVIRGGSGRCVCLSCYARAAGTLRPVPRALRLAVSAALSELKPA